MRGPDQNEDRTGQNIDLMTCQSLALYPETNPKPVSVNI